MLDRGPLRHQWSSQLRKWGEDWQITGLLGSDGLRQLTSCCVVGEQQQHGKTTPLGTGGEEESERREQVTT